MRPIVLGRDPFAMEAIARDVFVAGAWQFQAMTGNFAFAGIDMALWDLCGKACGQPLYRLLRRRRPRDGRLFLLPELGDAEEVAAQCREGVERGYTVFYLKVGVDADGRGGDARRAAPRHRPGPQNPHRRQPGLDLPEAARLLSDWHEQFDLDFVEAPVPIDPVELMPTQAPGRGAALRQRGPVARGRRLPDHREPLRRLSAASARTGSARCAACSRSPRRAGKGWRVCKHTHGELGLAAAAGQHLMLTAPQRLRRPPADRPAHGRRHPDRAGCRSPPARPGARSRPPASASRSTSTSSARYHQDYLDDGEFPPYGAKFGQVE